MIDDGLPPGDFKDHQLALLRAEVKTLRQTAALWRSIDTAPKDGTLILVLTPSPQFVRWWTDIDGYGADYPWVGRDGCAYSRSQVTHWLPLPPAPSESHLAPDHQAAMHGALRRSVSVVKPAPGKEEA